MAQHAVTLPIPAHIIPNWCAWAEKVIGRLSRHQSTYTGLYKQLMKLNARLRHSLHTHTGYNSEGVCTVPSEHIAQMVALRKKILVLMKHTSELLRHNKTLQRERASGRHAAWSEKAQVLIEKIYEVGYVPSEEYTLRSSTAPESAEVDLATRIKSGAAFSYISQSMLSYAFFTHGSTASETAQFFLSRYDSAVAVKRDIPVHLDFAAQICCKALGMEINFPGVSNWSEAVNVWLDLVALEGAHADLAWPADRFYACTIKSSSQVPTQQ